MLSNILLTRLLCLFPFFFSFFFSLILELQKNVQWSILIKNWNDTRAQHTPILPFILIFPCVFRLFRYSLCRVKKTLKLHLQPFPPSRRNLHRWQASFKLINFSVHESPPNLTKPQSFPFLEILQLKPEYFEIIRSFFFLVLFGI